MSEERKTPEELSEAPAAESMEDFKDELDSSMKKIEEGDILSGTVIAVSDEEVTLDLGYYTEGIIKAEDYSREPGFQIKEHAAIGDTISATVVKTDSAEGNILLSKVKADDILAWERLQELKESQAILDVTVKGIVKSGVIAYVKGIRGFIPASKLSLQYVENLDSYLSKQIQVRVFEINPEKKQLILSAREILKERAEEERKTKISNVQPGFVTEGTVESIQPYGAFINLGNGLSGLVHVSQISEKRIKSPAEVLSTGDRVKVKVIAIKDGKLSLSMKALNDAAASEIEEESYRLPKAEELTTSLGSLFSNIKLDK